MSKRRPKPVTPPKKADGVVTGTVDLSKVARGHHPSPRASSLGDRRTKRKRTRSDQDRAALEE